MEFLSIFILSQSLVAVIKSHVSKKRGYTPFQIKMDQKSAFGKLQPLSTFLCSQNYVAAAISFWRISTSIIDLTVLGITDGTTYKRIGMKKW